MSVYITAIRRHIGTDLLFMPTTAIILLDDRDRVLMQRRSDNGLWSCPGGILDIGETVLDNAIRETLEETGLVVEQLELFGIFSGGEFGTTYPNGDQTAVVQFAFVTRQFSGVPRIDAESLELSWIATADMPTALVSSHAGFLRELPAYLAGERVLPIVP